MVVGKNDRGRKRRIGQKLADVVEIARKADIGTPSRQQRLHGAEHAEVVVDDDQRFGDEITVVRRQWRQPWAPSFDAGAA